MMIKTRLYFAVLTLFIFTNCASSASSEQNPVNTQQPSSRTRQSAALYEGDGGRNIRLAIMAPGKNNPATPDWLLIFIQGILTRDFNRFSAITVIDRQFAEVIRAEQQLSLSGDYSEENFIRIGKMTNAQYVLTGMLLRVSGGMFSLQLAIANSETGERKASFSEMCTEAQLKETTILKKAAEDLLAQLGVILTDAGKQQLFSTENTLIESETALSKGIAAENNGSTIEALSRYYEAGSLPEALQRLSGLSETISGSLGQDARNAIAQRKAWLDLIAECEAYYKRHLPYEIVYNPEIIKENIDYKKETVDLKLAIMLKPLPEATKVIRGIMNDLDKTGKKAEWDLWFWPANLNFFGAGNALAGKGTYFVNAENILKLVPVNDKNYIDPSIGKEYFKVNFIDSPTAPPTFGKSVVLTALLLDEHGKVISRTRQTFYYAMGYCVNSGQRSETRSSIWDFKLAPMALPSWLNFRGVSADAITDNISIKIHSLDNVELDTAASDYVKISADSSKWILY